MKTRTIILFLLISGLIPILFAVDDMVVLRLSTRAGSITVPAGSYHVKVQGALVFFVSAKDQKSVSTVATIEKLEKKAPYTAIDAIETEGGQLAKSILLQGADYKIIFSR
jgi:hypothetical protein